MRLVASLTAAVLLWLLMPVAASAARTTRTEAAIRAGVNHARRQHGLHGLRASATLARAASAHTYSMLRGDYFSHGSFSTRVRHYVRARSIGENLAMGTSCSASLVVRMWMQSAPHRAVLLSRRFHRAGVGVRVGRLGPRRACVVTADFAS